jgi:hypothetical protein
MGIKLYAEPRCEKPVLLVGWPGIGNVGIIAVDGLRRAVGAEPIGEIEPWDFFYPAKAIFKGGVLEDLVFPRNTFYYKRHEGRDLLFFIGEEQPSVEGKAYAEGLKAYKLACLVLDAAARFGCRRIYTSGAAVAVIHHAMIPQVWAVPTAPELLDEVKRIPNAVLMHEGSISGLNGLLLGVAKERGFEGICVMGEVPMYIAHFPLLYPRASKSVMQFLIRALGITADLGGLDDSIKESDDQIEEIYKKIPAEMRAQLEKLREAGADKAQEETRETHEQEFMEGIGRLIEDIDKSLKDGGTRRE